MAPPLFMFPPRITMEIFDGSNWLTWSSHSLAVCQMNGYWHHITDTKLTGDTTWDDEEHFLLGVFKVYIQKDILLAVSDDSKFKNCKEKWEEIQCIYGGIRSMSTFNTWVALTGMALDDTSPMLPQLQKLNDA
jgi:hypothetical protein